MLVAAQWMEGERPQAKRTARPQERRLWGPGPRQTPEPGPLGRPPRSWQCCVPSTRSVCSMRMEGGISTSSQVFPQDATWPWMSTVRSSSSTQSRSTWVLSCIDASSCRLARAGGQGLHLSASPVESESAGRVSKSDVCCCQKAGSFLVLV